MRKHPQPAEPTQGPSLWAEPKLGIFWLVGKRLVLAGTPLAKAESHAKLRELGERESSASVSELPVVEESNSPAKRRAP
jgi:hypothetical protein